MNKLNTLTALMFAVTLLINTKIKAQNIYFRFIDGTEQVYLLDDIRKQTVVGNIISLWLIDGTIYQWDLGQLKFYNYDPNLITNSNYIDKLNPINIYPNPSAKNLSVEFILSEATDVFLQLTNMEGKIIKETRLGELKKGAHSFNWISENSDASMVPEGNYLFHLLTNHGKITKPLIIKY